MAGRARVQSSQVVGERVAAAAEVAELGSDLVDQAPEEPAQRAPTPVVDAQDEGGEEALDFGDGDQGESAGAESGGAVTVAAGAFPQPASNGCSPVAS